MYTSQIKEIGRVDFPSFTGERVYMRKFTKQSGLPHELQRWQTTVDAMLSGVDCEGDIFIMIDQGTVKAGQSHRRAGAHVDGYWIEGKQAHGGGGHRIAGAWDNGGGGWKTCDFTESEGIILASDIAACRAFAGDYTGIIGDGGDCTAIDTSRMSSTILKPFVAYAGNVSMIHESLPVNFDCERTLVRLNVTGWAPN